ncbi:hypothetical protein Bca4012_020044 [Brassica carinata]
MGSHASPSHAPIARHSGPDGLKSVCDEPLKVPVVAHRNVWHDGEVGYWCLWLALRSWCSALYWNSPWHVLEVAEECLIWLEPEPVNVPVQVRDVAGWQLQKTEAVSSPETPEQAILQPLG